MQRLASTPPTENPLKRPARFISRGGSRAASEDEVDENENGIRDCGNISTPRILEQQKREQRPNVMPWQRPRLRSDLPQWSWAESGGKPSCCEKCTAMTGTREGLAALLSDEGYEHYNWYDIQESAHKRCGLCGYMWELLEGSIWDSGDESEEGDDNYDVTRKAVRVFAQLEDIETLSTRPKNFQDRHPLDGPRMYSLVVAAPTGNDPPEVLHLVTAPDDLAARYIAGRLGSRTLGHVEVAAIRSWLAEEYSLENRASPPELPMRVIDVEPNGSAGCRIHQTQYGEKAQYAALSYCWGKGSQQVTTTRSNITNFSSELPAGLSATIRDAIRVCREIGLRFLWVDALCIVQDDDNDKLDQIARMGSIYKNATLTIVAACAETAAAGFLSSENTKAQCTLPFFVDDRTSGTVSIRGSEGAEVTVAADEPLFRRGWAFQELMLSRRTLIFDTKQITMKSIYSKGSNYMSVVTTHVEFETQCRDLPLAVFGIDEPMGRRSRESYLVKDQNNRWPSMVEEYSGRDLTMWTDRLPALAGIATELALAWDDIYLAGLWHRTLVQHLGWIRDKYLPIDTPRPAIHPGRLAGPSWSWVTVPHRATLRPISKPDTKLISYHVQPTSERSPFGQVDSAHIILDALLIPPLKVDQESLHRGRHCSPPDDTTPSIRSEDLWHFHMDLEDDRYDKDRLWLLYLGQLQFLMIDKLESGRFRRLGHTELHDTNVSEQLRMILTLGKREKVILE